MTSNLSASQSLHVNENSETDFETVGQSVPVKMHLKWFNGSKGFGFVVPEEGRYDAFLHVTTLQRCGINAIGEGAVLMCLLTEGDKGKQVREVVEVIEQGSLSTIPVVNVDEGTYTMGGLVKWFKPEQGFGFIIPDDGMKDIFIHQTILQALEIEELQSGQRVRVTLKDVEKGREAVKIELID
jgi:CspA family cold shock protein